MYFISKSHRTNSNTLNIRHKFFLQIILV